MRAGGEAREGGGEGEGGVGVGVGGKGRGRGGDGGGESDGKREEWFESIRRRQCTYQVNATHYVTISSLAAVPFNFHLRAVQDDVRPSTSEDAK
ncbi:hypothetical protein V1478_013044 [Vespula squamosa]|uniref:Uncharacterized protein n=1 Tax=Vespula squamosa TaxID=30214 RepID=A0ABD2A9P0_VESSQ